MSEAAALIDLRKSSKEDISQFLSGIGEKPFRAKQIHEWIWKKSATSIDDMTNLSLSTRDQLKAHFTIRPALVDKEQKSTDGTIKSALKLHDNHLIESVLIPQDERMTACVSSQVGCSLSCKFCATGYMDRERNLDASEIYDQVVAVARQAEQNYEKPLSNIVYMGMGEPLLNYKNVLESIDRITAPDGLNMSPKRITVSTAGIAKMIKKLADDQVKFNLALSLHAANDEKRNKIMPINESNTLEALREALNYFYKKTGNKITFEYILFYDFNDSLQDAKELYEFWKRVPARINIIEYNPIAEANYRNADADTLNNFTKFLTNKGVNVHVRRSRGKDIDAACGQLANKN
ncbi:23S rRNA m(2)A-2503 methyltransferase [Reichenbachiella faecimaris]|uniref:Probable dual-specificity RNA methyltransferase RlmN n=1 Tax=Reichenbachiella faecimaris TaxID=692418 RepID=A0A1W2GIF6_REIFA|nr:23S rRNA (adenine(2503)-C(2))-methyltransferase RlmN [Reichenbachiella faecimaris]SMD36449.1 23S rRNA m(2)A-2503 methyltransferase [Reichenbachiella faecimaris]